MKNSLIDNDDYDFRKEKFEDLGDRLPCQEWDNL